MPVEIKDLALRAQKLFRRAVALQTPRHALRLRLPHRSHVIDLSVTAKAAHSAIHVRGMVEINIIGRLVNAHPLNGQPGLSARLHGGQLRAGGFDL